MSDPTATALGLVTSIIRAIVDTEAAVTVRVTEAESCTLLEVEVAKSDVGKVVGSRGETAMAIRSILRAIGGRHKRKFIMEIKDQ